jgi:hypothetical protein
MAPKQIQVLSHAQITQTFAVISPMTTIMIFAIVTGSAFLSTMAPSTEEHVPITIGTRLQVVPQIV